MKLTSTTVRHSVFAGIFLGVALLGVGVVSYQISTQGAHLTAQVSVLAEQQAQEGTYYKLQKISETSAADRAALQRLFLARESDSIDFLSLVEEVAPTVGVTLDTKATTLKSVTDTDQRDWIEIAFAFSGKREQVFDFVTLLETLPYVLRLTAVDLQALSAADWKGGVTLQVQIAYDE